MAHPRAGQPAQPEDLVDLPHLITSYYSIEPDHQEAHHILLLSQVPDEETEKRLAPLRQKLFDARARRVRPFLDTKVVTSWNGQMIAGYAVAGQCLGGTSGLLVRFNPHTGQARVKPLAGRELTGIVKSEETFGRDLLDRVAAPPDDRITMF